MSLRRCFSLCTRSTPGILMVPSMKNGCSIRFTAKLPICSSRLRHTYQKLKSSSGKAQTLPVPQNSEMLVEQAYDQSPLIMLLDAIELLEYYGKEGVTIGRNVTHVKNAISTRYDNIKASKVQSFGEKVFVIKYEKLHPLMDSGNDPFYYAALYYKISPERIKALVLHGINRFSSRFTGRKPITAAMLTVPDPILRTNHEVYATMRSNSSTLEHDLNEYTIQLPTEPNKAPTYIQAWRNIVRIARERPFLHVLTCLCLLTLCLLVKTVFTILGVVFRYCFAGLNDRTVQMEQTSTLNASHKKGE